MKRIAPLFFLFLFGCATFQPPPVPETTRQSLAVTEIGVQAVARTIITLQQSGVIERGSNIDIAVRSALSTANSALKVWRANPDSLDAQTAALAALTAVQGMLLRIEGG